MNSWRQKVVRSEMWRSFADNSNKLQLSLPSSRTKRASSPPNQSKSRLRSKRSRRNSLSAVSRRQRWEDEIKVLQSQLALKERKAQDLERKLLQVDQDLEVKLHAALKEVEATKFARIPSRSGESQRSAAALSIVKDIDRLRRPGAQQGKRTCPAPKRQEKIRKRATSAGGQTESIGG